MQPAYLLHARAYRDTSLLAELFIPEAGRVSAIARGARSNRRGYSQRAILQPFQPLWIELGGRGELKMLRQVEARGSAVPLQRQSLFSGLYVNELLCRLMHRDDPQPRLFAAYEHTLPNLLHAGVLDIALRHFELNLLDELGYGLDLGSDDSGAAIDPAQMYRFDAALGLVRMPCASRTMLFAGRDIADFAAGNYSPQARRTLKLLCRAALRPHLGERPLHSRTLFSTGK